MFAFVFRASASLRGVRFPALLFVRGSSSDSAGKDEAREAREREREGQKCEHIQFHAADGSLVTLSGDFPR